MKRAVPRGLREARMQGNGGPSVTVLDHLVLGVPDLDEALRRIRDSWGCRVTRGGRHPRYGSGDSGRSLLERLRDGVEAEGVRVGEVLDKSRRRPDGVLLTWRLTDPFASRMGGIVPFLMDWGTTPHPSAGAEPEVELLNLTLVHPEYGRASKALAGLGQGPVEEGPVPRLRARLATPGGVMELAGPAD